MGARCSNLPTASLWSKLQPNHKQASIIDLAWDNSICKHMDSLITLAGLVPLLLLIKLLSYLSTRVLWRILRCLPQPLPLCQLSTMGQVISVIKSLSRQLCLTRKELSPLLQTEIEGQSYSKVWVSSEIDFLSMSSLNFTLPLKDSVKESVKTNQSYRELVS